MEPKLTLNGGTSSFKLTRPPLITTSGFVSEVNADVTSQLDELNRLLSKRIFTHEAAADPMGADGGGKNNNNKDHKAAALNVKGHRVLPDVKTLLSQELTPKRIPDNDWRQGSLSDQLRDAKESLEKLTLSEYVDMTPELSALKYAFQSNLSTIWLKLDYNTKAILDGYPAISDYLVAYSFHVMDLQEIYGLKNFILSNRAGAKNVIKYATVGAARAIIDREQLKVPNHNNDGSEIVRAIADPGLSLSSASFATAVQAIIDDHIFNSAESKLIENAGIGTLPAGMKPLLVKLIKRSTVPITAENVKFFLPLFVSQIQGVTAITDPKAVGDTVESDKDFDVQFLEDDKSLIQISVSAVKCAAQLYYGMVLGDQLEVFDTVNYFTHKYLVRGGIEIQDSRLREDLQMYVFSNRFTDTKTNKIVDRTRPAERKMFYRQVFDYGNIETTDDLIVNKEFTNLWKVLILESANYLERAQAAFNPDSYVSRQKVM